MGSSTSHSAYGPALNPWESRTRISSEDVLSPGGSSGGSAGAVASFLCHGAIGSDTGGSVRQPASFCGVVGFKPSYGSLSRHGLVSYASSFDTPGVLARSVMDSALLFDSMYRGKDEKDPTSVDLFPSLTAPYQSLFSPGAPLSSLLSSSCRPPLGASADVLDTLQSLSLAQSELSSSSLHGVVVGVPREYSLVELDPQVRAHWEASLRMLRDAGATILSVSVPSLRLALPTYYLLACAEASSNLSRYDGIRYGYRSSPSPARAGAEEALESIAGDLHREMSRSRGEGFGPQVLRRILAGTFVLSESAFHDYFGKAVLARELLVAELHSLLAPSSPSALPLSLSEEARRVDCIVGPTSPTLPFHQSHQPDFATSLLHDFMTVSANLAGTPAIR
jgi:aspartyl-tRNA(Asn)/glutamyl-tRNA(Gln) amidotransferase subunit A